MLLLPAYETSTTCVPVATGNRIRRPAPATLTAAPTVGASRTANGGRVLHGLSAAGIWWAVSAVWLCTELLLRGEVHVLCPAEVDAELEAPVLDGD
jgi:hypothetical protein